MSKEIYISSTPHETRLAIVENDALTEIYYERENEYTLAGSIYNGKVTRVLPGMQSSFVEIGLERDAFLYITDFLEEAPDSAEFDTAAIGEHGPREARVPRLDASSGQIDSPRIEAPRSEGQRSEGQREGRNGEGRGGRGRRGRGDRHDRPERTPAIDRPVAAEASRMETTPEAAESSDSISEQPAFTSAESDAAELGEGAPGADGSRRWRGRRGRRRGRGPGAAAGSPAQGVAAEPAGSESPAYPLYPAEAESEPMEDSSSSIYEGAVHSIEAATQSAADAVFFPEPLATAAPTPVDPSPGSYNESRRLQQGRGEQGRDGARNDRQGRDRGGRGDRERGPRSDRSETARNEPGRSVPAPREAGRDDRSSRAPRGFSPSQPAYGVEQLPDAPVGDPIILPGESLSKYRKDGGGSTPTQPAAAAPAPSTEFVISGAWDGGSTLPGETLSRHRRADVVRLEPRAELRPESRVSLRNPSPQPAGPKTDAPRPEIAHVHVLQEEDGPSVAATPETQPEIALVAHPEQVPASEISHEAAPLSLQSSDEDEIEIEPVEGSASHRVDPVAPSELRQAAFMEEEAAPEPQQETALVPVQEAPVMQHDATDEFAFGHTHLFTPEPGVPEMPAPNGSPEGDPTYPVTIVDEIGTSLPGHDITTLNASGDMLSDRPAEESAPPAFSLPPQELPEPTAPILHETAVVDATDLVEEHAGALDEAEDADTQFFSPGYGDLEEELIEDDDDEVAALHASYDDENEDLEEETLEGTADLGTMLREMSIDQITRPAGDTDLDSEDEDFENDLPEKAPSRLHTSPYTDADDAEEGSEEYARTAEATGDFSSDFREPEAATSADGGTYNERQGTRGRDPRRHAGRDRQSHGGDSSGRARNTGGGGDRDRGGRTGRTGRGSMQTTNLPAISELLKPGQEILVQIAKEPIAKKGARITSHIALPGRFLVFMPTVNHTGVSRKIESDGERRRLKEILLSEKGEAAGGFIVRTAAAGATEEELRSDLRFLLNLWTDIKQRSESSKSPALIYHDLNLVERILRDQVTDNFSAIWVDTETEYERVLRFLQRFQPALIRRVKLYLKESPLFEQFGITEEINKALRSKVWLKSGGSIVINQTEALVAIDINTGKFVGKTARLEDTIVKTNLDAIPEIVRQIRLRDLGGIIIIDFIDMDERKNRNKVMAALEEELKSDRAPSKVLQFNDFGLVAITRKRVKQSLERTLSTTCNVCVGTGMVKSPVTVCNDIYIEMRKMMKHLDKGDVMLRVHPEVVKQLKSPGTRWLQEMEEISGKTILVKSDPSLHPEQFDIH